MDFLCGWINNNLNKKHPLIVAAMAHYNIVRIHPFDDGNGRGARLLMNLILIKKGFPPAIIKNENRRRYIETLTEADNGKLNPLIKFIADSCLETQKLLLEDFK